MTSLSVANLVLYCCHRHVASMRHESGATWPAVVHYQIVRVPLGLAAKTTIELEVSFHLQQKIVKAHPLAPFSLLLNC